MARANLGRELPGAIDHAVMAVRAREWARRDRAAAPRLNELAALHSASSAAALVTRVATASATACAELELASAAAIRAAIRHAVIAARARQARRRLRTGDDRRQLATIAMTISAKSATLLSWAVARGRGSDG